MESIYRVEIVGQSFFARHYFLRDNISQDFLLQHSPESHRMDSFLSSASVVILVTTGVCDRGKTRSFEQIADCCEEFGKHPLFVA